MQEVHYPLVQDCLEIGSLVLLFILLALAGMLAVSATFGAC